MDTPPLVEDCPPWKDSRGLRHYCRYHPEADWCRCACGALHPTQPATTKD